MISASADSDALRRENAELLLRLEEAESTIRAISSGEVDAFIVTHGIEEHVLVLEGVDRPYRLLIERMHQAAVTLDAADVISYANRSFAELIGNPADVVGLKLEQFVATEDHGALHGLLSTGRMADAEHELKLRRPDGLTVLVCAAISPLVKQAGLRAMVLTDLTEQKRQEVERARYAREHAARTAAEAAASVLRDADRRKDEFLAMLAHELRGPLAPLRNAVEILGLSSPDNPQMAAIRDMMARQIENMVRLVDDLLDVSRVTQGKIVLQQQPIDLRDVVQRAIESTRPLVTARGHHLAVAMPDTPIPIHGDMIRLVQVLINLVNNACKFTARGGEIDVTVVLERDDALVRVRDNGIGISAEMLPRVFDLFTQVDPTMSRAEGGLGIGLTLARRLVEMHGGTLTGASAGAGQGSEFAVRLPLRVEHDAGNDAGQSDAPARAPHRRVLVVDDNRDAAESMSLLLRLGGHEVEHVFSGEDALSRLPSFQPDVILLDIGLPGMNGYDVAARVRQAASNHVHLVALSGYGGEDDRRRSRDAGFEHHLVKPVEPAVLSALLASL